MIRLTGTMCFTLASLGLLFGSQAVGQIAPASGSVVDHYQSLFNAPPAVGTVSATQAIGIAGSVGSYSPRSFVAPQPATSSLQPGYLSGGFDVGNAFGQKSPSPAQQSAQQLNLQHVDHSQMIYLINLPRSEKFNLVRTGVAPTMQEMDGLWYGFNTGQATKSLGFSQFIKDLRTNSPNPMGTNIVVHQVPQSQLNSPNAWRPKFEPTGDFKREGSFALIPPDGVGRYGHTTKGVYALGGNKLLYPPNAIVSRFVKLDQNYMLAESTIRVGNRNVHVGFFGLQRIPPTALTRR